MILVEGDPKASFTIATTLRCWKRHNSFPWISRLYPWYLPYNAVCQARRHQVPFFESWVWLDLGMNILAHTLSIRAQTLIDIQTKIKKTQDNSKSHLYGLEYETVNSISKECRKIPQKEYESMNEWMGECNPLGIVKETNISTYIQMVYEWMFIFNGMSTWLWLFYA